MRSAALAWNIAPPISTLDPNTLIAPFDETVLEGGFLRVGQKTLRRGRELGITATEDMVRLKIEAHRYTKERLPYLSISFISGLIGKSYSTTQRYIKRLRQKGFLHVYTKDWALAGAMPNGLSCYFYDFSPFYAQLQALEQEVGSVAHQFFYDFFQPAGNMDRRFHSSDRIGEDRAPSLINSFRG